MKKMFKKYMKTSEFILIFTLIGCCLAETEIIDCENDFIKKLIEKNEEQCTKIDSCFYNSLDNKCIEIHPCSFGDGDSNLCKIMLVKNVAQLKENVQIMNG